jgi:hypothetical protein
MLSLLSISASQPLMECKPFAKFEKSRPSAIVPVALELAFQFSSSAGSGYVGFLTAHALV